MVERDDKDEFVRIRCDTCDNPAPSTTAPFLNHGLIGLGWDCKGGRHVCPKCVPVAPLAE